MTLSSGGAHAGIANAIERHSSRNRFFISRLSNFGRAKPAIYGDVINGSLPVITGRERERLSRDDCPVKGIGEVPKVYFPHGKIRLFRFIVNC